MEQCCLQEGADGIVWPVCVFLQRENKMCLCLSWHLHLARAILIHLGDVDFQGCATCHKGRLVSLGDAQCTQAYSSAERVDTASSIQSGALAWAVSHLSPGWFAARGHAGRGTLGTTDVMGKVVPVVVLLCTVLGSGLSFHNCGSRTPGWHRRELVRIQAASHLPQLPFE